MFSNLVRGVAVSGLIALAAANPAMAEGKGDRAQKAIAEAQGKIDAAARVPQNGDVPQLVTDAHTQLKMAQESVAAGHKEDAIQQAINAQQLADHALTESRQNVATANAEHRADVASAQADAASANARADQAEQNAQTAQQTAAAAQADAAAARSQPPMVIAQAPQPTTTEVTTTSTRPASHRTTVVKKTVKRPAQVADRTTTTVTTNN